LGLCRVGSRKTRGAGGSSGGGLIEGSLGDKTNQESEENKGIEFLKVVVGRTLPGASGEGGGPGKSHRADFGGGPKSLKILAGVFLKRLNEGRGQGKKSEGGV